MFKYSFAAPACLFLSLLSSQVAGQIAVPYTRVVSPASNTPAGENATHASRVLAALNVAREAAKNGYLDVSYEAVRRAVGSGPPVAVSGLGGLLGGQQLTTQIRTSNSSPVVDPLQQELAKSLAAVNAVWIAQEASPKECFAIWRDVIFPAARPAEAFSYCVNPPVARSSYNVDLSAAEPDPIDQSGTAALAYWAHRANEVSALDAMLSERELQPAAKVGSFIVRMRLALEQETGDGIELCKQLASSTAPIISGPNSGELMYVTSRLLEKIPSDAAQRDAVLGALAASVGGTQALKTNQWLEYALSKAASDAVKNGDLQGFTTYGNAVLRSLDPLRNGNEDYVQQLTARVYAKASDQAFSSGHLELGIKCLREQVRLSSSVVRENDSTRGLVDVVEPAFRTLLAMDAGQRYDILKDLPWELPLLGLSSVAAYAPSEQIPQRFVDNYKNYHKVDKLPIENVFQAGSNCLSLLEWTIRDAITLGQLDEIEQRIIKLEQDGSDDAALARAVLAKAQNLPIDVQASLVGEGEERSLRPDVSGSRGSLVPLDLDIIDAAIRRPATLDAGLDLAERFQARGKASYTNEVLYGRHAVAKAKIASQSPPTTSDVLKHFVRVDDYRGRTLSLGLPRESIWLEDDNGDWQHQACTVRSSLLLKYPLAGTYKVAFSCTDGTYAECAATVHGVTMDYRGYVGNVAAAIVGQRSQFSIPSAKITRGQKMQIELVRGSETGTLTLSCNDSNIATFNISDNEFPFAGPHAMMHRRMALEDFTVLGEATIPRSVELLSPRLVGWSSLFHSRLLPQVENYIASGTEEDRQHPLQTQSG